MTSKAKDALQCAAVGMVFIFALLADGLMETLGPKDFLIAGVTLISLSGLVLWGTNRA